MMPAAAAAASGSVLTSDQYLASHAHSTGSTAGHRSGGLRPPSHMHTFPPNRSHTTSQPGAYPNRSSQSLENLLRPRAMAPLKSPQTPAGGQVLRSSPGGPGSYPPALINGKGTFTHPGMAPLTSYPPPPISPMSQFNSPPPSVSVPKLLPPPVNNKSNLQKPDSNPQTYRGEEQHQQHLRVPSKKNKVSFGFSTQLYLHLTIVF